MIRFDALNVFASALVKIAFNQKWIRGDLQ